MHPSGTSEHLGIKGVGTDQAAVDCPVKDLRYEGKRASLEDVDQRSRQTQDPEAANKDDVLGV
jgi:hypothetical protein